MIDFGFGQSELPWGLLTETEIRRILQGIKDTGAKRVRLGVQVGTWDNLDSAILLCVEYGLKPLLCVMNNPALGFDSSVAGYGNTCKAIASRYGPAGSGTLRNTVSEMELYNEPNWFLNAPGNASPETFVQYLRSAYTAIKSVHTSCTVIAGGVTGGAEFFGLVTPVHWYQRIYAAGGGQYFDAAGFHWYDNQFPATDDLMWTYLTGLRALMVANGDATKKVWVTEVGAGFPAPNVPDLVTARDWLKAMVEGIESYDWTGPFYVYNWRNYSGGDTAGGVYGMVTNDFVPRSPLFEYAQTIAGTPSDPGDIVPPGDPTGLTYSDVTSNSARFTWNANPAIDGVTNYRLKTLAGVQLSDATNTSRVVGGMPSGTPQSFIVTAVDAAGNESGPSNVVSLTTDSLAGSRADFAVTFTGSDIPPTLSQLGLGFTVSGGVALPNAPTIDKEYITVAPCTLEMQSPDHSSRITLAGTAGGADRTALAIVRMNSDGTEWIAAASPGGGKADSLLIVMYVGGKVVQLAAMNTIPGGGGDDLELIPKGNVYTARIIGPDSSVKAELGWTDTNGIYPGSLNRRASPGWMHVRSQSINYPPPGITRWAATDVGTVQTTSDLWMLGIVNDRDWPELMGVGDWELLI